MHAEILTYSRSRGLFAGISLDGSTLRPDNSATEKVYGRKVSARDVVIGHKVSTPKVRPAPGERFAESLAQEPF